ncbi:MAG: cell division protein FtsQ/DivIB [Pseudomonadota bacterium]
MSIGRVRNHYGMSFSWKMLLKFLAFTILLALSTFSYNKFKNAEYFPIDSVKIFGVRHVDHNEVQTLIAPLVSKGFFDVEVDKIKERLLQLPWISQVMVRRVWPNLVTVTIEEKQPLALWNNSSLLSTKGELFTPATGSIPGNLPQLAGPSGEQLFMAQYYTKINDVLMPLHFKIARLELTPSMTWNLILDNGIKMSVGHKDVLTRLNHFVKVYSKIVGNRVAEVDYIDLRYPNGMAVRWKSVT